MAKLITIIGNGNMAQAIINGLIKQDYQIEVAGRNIEKLKILKQQIPDIDIKILGNTFDINNKNIILCVKPLNLYDIKDNLVGTSNILYSVLAGTTLESLKENIKAKYYIRTMPNIAAKFNKSMTTITGDKEAKSSALNIFNNIGKTLWVETQKELDISTAVAGSGPAFLAYFADAIIEGGISGGLSKADATVLTRALFEGFTLLLDKDEPSNIIKKVMSPNGTTWAGYNYLNNNNIGKEISNTIQAAYNRAFELAKK